MKRKYRFLVVIGTLTLLILGSGITYSLFNASASMSSSDQDIAKFIFNAESLDHLELSLIDLNPGNNEEYDFSVNNNYSGSISNVTVEYQLTIKTFHLIPLIIELYRINGEEEELVLTCDESYTRNSQNELLCNSPIQELGYASELLDDYILKVEFPDEYNDSTYAGLADYINIEIKSWQKI